MARTTPGALRLRTACPLDCPDTCSLEVEVEDDRLVGVGPAPDGPGTNPFTQGWICHKVRRHADRVHGPDRLHTPLVRSGPRGSGAFVPVSWDDALDRVADAMVAARDRHGAEAVVPYLYNSSTGALAARALTPLLFRRFGASRVAHTICAATAGLARELTLGAMPSVDPTAVLDAELVVIWGANPSVSNSHWQPLVERARRRGARLVVVDPRRIPLAGRADLHLPVRPGTDVVAALALAHAVAERGGIDRDFVAAHVEGLDEYLEAAAAWPLDRAADECGVPESDLDTFAGWLAERRPTLFRPGWGMERNRNGGSAWRAVLALPVLTGNFGRPGAGVYWSTSRAFPWDADTLTADVLGEGAPPPGRLLNQNLLGRDLLDVTLDPPIDVLFVQGANPAVMNPDQPAVLAGLGRDDLFTVVHDQVLTDTARYADVVLPATTHFEAADVTSSYGTFGLEPLPPVIPRVGESRTNDEVAHGLAVRLGEDPARFDPDPARLLALAGYAPPHGDPDGGWRPIDPGPQVPTEPIRLVVDAPGVDRVPAYRPRRAEYPLTLLSPASARTVNSIFGERGDLPAVVTLHPDDAAARGIADGHPVRVFDDRSVVELTARVDAGLRPGVVVVPKGLWARATPNGLTANAFAPATLSDLAGGACFNDARVDVAPLP